MPKLYLAKVNLNSCIFSVYDEELDINEVLRHVYNCINTEVKYTIKKTSTYTDSTGSIKRYKKTSEYSFAQISKKDNVITGTILRKYTKPNEEENKETQKIETVIKMESVGIRFYFDVKKEMVTFCERQCFGYNQFTNAFNHLLNKCSKIYVFETFLQKDKSKLEKKIKELHNITKVRAVLIPPNPNGRKITSIKDRCINTNSTKMICEFESDNLKMDSEEMQEIREFVAAGYGDLTATGTNENGKNQKISSSSDAAYCVNIEDNLDDDSFNSEAKSLIVNFEEYKRKNDKDE